METTGLTGRRYPHLGPIEEIESTIRDRAPPFDGRCAACQAPGAVQIPILFIERHAPGIENGSFVRRVTAFAGYLIANVGAVDVTTLIPLTLCEQCAAEFESTRPRAITLWLVGIGLWGAVYCVIYLYLEELVLSLILTAIVTAAAAFRIFRMRDADLGGSRSVPRALKKWIRLIPRLPEAMKEALDYEIVVGDSTPHSE